MLNRAPGRNEQQITSAATERAAPTGIPEKAATLAPAVDMPALEDRPGELKRETSFLGECLRLAFGTAGFLIGGPAGAALGSAVGQLAGEIAARQTRMIWPTLARALVYPKTIGRKEIVLIVLAMTAAIPSGVGATLICPEDPARAAGAIDAVERGHDISPDRRSGSLPRSNIWTRRQQLIPSPRLPTATSPTG